MNKISFSTWLGSADMDKVLPLVLYYLLLLLNKLHIDQVSFNPHFD